MSGGCFIVGTDTGAGKTVVAAGLVHWLRAQGIDAAPMKPVQTGAEAVDGAWRAPDLDSLLAGSGLSPDAALYAQMAPCCFEPACSPHLAARAAGRPVDPEAIAGALRALQRRFDTVVCEGAGGLLVPLDDAGRTMADLVTALGLPALVVARAGLGTLNHTLLTLEALAARRIPVAAVVLTETEPADAEAARIQRDNAATLKHWIDVPVAGPVPHTDHPDGAPVAATLDAAEGVRAALVRRAVIPAGDRS